MNTIVNDRINEKILYHELDSGLKIYFMPKPGFVKKYAVFTTNYGSIDNVFVPIGESDPIEVPEGIAHFLEHKLFEEEEANIFDKFSKLGAYVNASTSFNQTSYLFYTTDYFYDCLELLIKFVQSPYLTDENVEKEKGIIAQEIRMYEDNPKWRVFFNCLKAMYINHPIKIDIAGTVESINTITKELLYKSYNTFYHPSNMVLFVVGDLSFDEIIETVKKSEKIYEKTDFTVERIFEEEPKQISQKIIEEKMYVSTPLFYIGFKDYDLGLEGKESIKKDIVTNMILDMLFTPSSEFFNDLYNEGLIDSNFGAYYTGKKTYGHSLIVGQSEVPEKVHQRVVDLFSQNPADILIDDDFERLKKKNLGSFLMGFNSIEFIANNFTDLYFDKFNLLDYLDVLESISFEDLLNRFKEHFTPDNIVLSIVRPS
ncbi:pitrilysin family protein [Tissierella sp. Yu-01]|uniref:EF-P 5-aminopentanol modification-associated protein YfmH n=1 Tax=Tissierella sp. Yu-01 TaxID=3035694 RepID=UPI00240DCA72|nr:pitrilysin family protein [Tissierella sp. Yu-01]WFA09622.1 pitrilysin family protein [Tissierella sp. Yu-01]